MSKLYSLVEVNQAYIDNRQQWQIQKFLALLAILSLLARLLLVGDIQLMFVPFEIH